MSDKEKESSLDIGLSSLLEGKAAFNEPISSPQEETSGESPNLFGDILESHDSESSESIVENDEPPSDHLEPQVTAEVDPIVQLAQDGNWNEVHRHVEPLMSGISASDPIRLWWLLSQLHIGQMPASVLCAPFDEYVSALIEHDSFGGLKGEQCGRLREAAVLLSDKLEDAGEHDLSITILERVYRLAKDSSITQRLEKLVDRNLEELPRRVTFHTPAEMKKRLHLLDLKRELDANSEKVISLVEEKEDQLGEVPAPKIVEGGGSRRAILLLAGLFGLCLGVWTLGEQGYFDRGRTLQVAGSVSDSGVSAPSGEVPGTSRIKDVSHLAALAYDVAASDGGGAKVEPNPTVEVPTIAVSNPPSPTEAPKAPLKKAQINTEGPVETDRIRGMIENGGSTSRYEDDREDSRRVEARDSRPPVRREPPPYRDSDRPYSDRRERPPGRWEGGERYEVMINTSVMERPSFHAKEVAELYVGDRVLVDARVGRWLKIRSVKGAPGYIMAQDAEKLFD